MRIGITGHRGLPAAIESQVRAALTKAVNAHPAATLTGVSCIADGPDSWFAQAVLDHGGQLEVVVAADTYREIFPPWHQATFGALLHSAVTVHHTGLREANSQAFMKASQIVVDHVDLLLAIWDGLPARDYGGTADVVGYAERSGVSICVLWPHGALRS